MEEQKKQEVLPESQERREPIQNAILRTVYDAVKDSMLEERMLEHEKK